MANRYSLTYLRMILCAIFLASPISLLAETGKVTLAWDPIDDPELAGYTVVWGQSPRAYGAAQSVGTNPEATVTLEAGKTYFVFVDHKRYTFSPRVITLYDSLADLNFQAE